VDNFPGRSVELPTVLSMDEEQIATAHTSPAGWPPGGDAAGAPVEVEPELSEWLKCLPVRHFAVVAFYLDLLATHGSRLGWPHMRQLDGRLRKLRFHLDGRAVRIMYWVAPDGRIVLLTVFMKARMRDEGELARARKVLRTVRSERYSRKEGAYA
jgi:phage-related protein